MSSQIVLDYNPLTGERVLFKYDNHANKITITHEQDIQKHIVAAHEQAVDDEQTKYGIKNDWWKYASVPNVIIIDMKNKHGVDFFDRNDWPKVLHLLNTEYRAFKTTSKTHKQRHG